MPKDICDVFDRLFSKLVDSKSIQQKACLPIEYDENKLTAIRNKLAAGEAQLVNGKFVDGEQFIKGLIARP